MIAGKRVIAIIPARGGSKGIPKKNIKFVGGRPLLAWTVEVALQVTEIDRVVLSTDNPEIAAVGQSCGCDVPFMRPAELAGDSVPGIAPVFHALDELPGYDLVVLLQPTSPLRQKEDIIACLEIVAAGAPACVTVQNLSHGLNLLYDLDDKGSLISLCSDEFSTARRQDVKKVYMLNGAVYVADIAELRKHQSFLFQGVKAYEMPHERSLDIDTEQDLDFADYRFSQILGK